MKYLRLDLKVCEGCGTLWLRTKTAIGSNSEDVYCRQCTVRLADFPAPRGKHRGGRKPRLARASHTHHAATAHAGGAR